MSSDKIRFIAVATNDIRSGMTVIGEVDERGSMWVRPATSTEIQDILRNAHDNSRRTTSHD